MTSYDAEWREARATPRIGCSGSPVTAHIRQPGTVDIGYTLMNHESVQGGQRGGVMVLLRGSEAVICPSPNDGLC